MSTILDRVAKIANRFDELTQLMADPVVAADFTPPQRTRSRASTKSRRLDADLSAL
jgi:hypothetical protein